MANPMEPEGGTRDSNAPLLVLSWLWVGVPLAWGILETLRTALALFR